MKVLDLFSGIGGFAIACHRAGMQTVAFCEQDRNARKVLSHHWPDVEFHNDVRTLSAVAVGPVDLICGGFPCQDLSVAGQRAGLAGERSGLWFEFKRLIGEISPEWVLIENVPGLCSSWSGDTPMSLGVSPGPGREMDLEETSDFAAVLGGLAELGYGFAYRVFDAQFFGVPQRRRRVFVVGCLGDWRSAAGVLFEPESLPWNPPPSREAGARVAASLTRGADSSGKGGYAGRRREDDVNLVAATLNCGGNSGGFRSEPGEHLVTHTLRAEGHDASEDGTGRGVPLVAGFKPSQGADCRSDGYRLEQSPTLSAASGGNQRPGVQINQSVRRLTPLECTRLQGFPDDWLDVPGLSNSAKYKALGNAVAVPVVEWIVRRLKGPPNGRTTVPSSRET